MHRTYRLVLNLGNKKALRAVTPTGFQIITNEIIKIALYP